MLIGPCTLHFGYFVYENGDQILYEDSLYSAEYTREFYEGDPAGVVATTNLVAEANGDYTSSELEVTLNFLDGVPPVSGAGIAYKIDGSYFESVEPPGIEGVTFSLYGYG
jgi:hypothetical protein